MKMHKWLLVLLLMWAAGFSIPASAQNTTEGGSTIEYTSQDKAASDPEMADVMRQDGKIYIVVAVLVSILLGILFYLISLDRKIGKLERELRQ
ncbi:CcmD family protein [Rufibacter aurantiacus]|uniref:CcmD family protein n=1 Tax=Rufibacter aurantiacus TaxID=2817374 RepID=UPI001FEE09AD|nr:CcmD family protein [Rufibacter aurantiacus]